MTTISSTRNTETRIRSKNLISGLRVVWGIAFLIAVIATLVSLQAYIRTCNCDAEIVAEWERMGIVQGVRIVFVILTAIHFSILMALSTLLIRRKADEQMAIFVAFMSIVHAIFLVTGPSASSAAWYYAVRMVTNFLTPIMWIAFFLVFPDGKFVPSWSKFFLAALTIALLASFLLPEPLSKPFSLAAAVSGLAGLFTGLWGMYRRLHSIPSTDSEPTHYISSPEERQQLKSFLFVFASAVILLLIAIPVQFAIQDVMVKAIYVFFRHILLATVQMAVPAAIGIAILRYRLWDIDLVLNKALVSAIVTISLGLVFVAVFFFVNVSSSLIGIQNIYVSTALPAGLIAYSFNPVRRRVRHFVDKSIYGFRFDLDQFQAAMRELKISSPGFYSGRTLSAYKLMEVIGKGGMGEIYKAAADGKEVAVKVIPSNLLKDQAIIQRFEREAQALSTLEHPNIVSCLDYGKADNTHYLVMDLINGIDLATYIKQRGKLSVAQARAVLNDLAEALDYAHSKGIFHRDIKPSNVMLTQEGYTQKTVLTDFGIAKLADETESLTGTGAIGTADYMSPEQIVASADVDHRTDIYAAGVMLYQLLTGELPYTGNAAQMIFAHLYQPVPDIKRILPEIPQSSADALSKSLSKKPEDRFYSLHEFATAFAA